MSSPATSSNAIPIPARKRTTSSASSFFDNSVSSSSSSSSPGRRRESLMSPTCSAASYTVINVGAESSPRLISCVKASQGFDWNQEIFLPSYADYQFDDDLETRQDPVRDIIVTDEEVEKMFPE